MEEFVRKILAHQNPNDRHTLLTRITVSLVLLFAFCVLYGFYGVIGSVIFYLLGVELAGISPQWMFLPFLLAILYGIAKCVPALIDYWRNYGHGA